MRCTDCEFSQETLPAQLNYVCCKLQMIEVTVWKEFEKCEFREREIETFEIMRKHGTGGHQMSEIREYRGKRVDNGEWVFGYLVVIKNKTFIYTGADVTPCSECKFDNDGNFTHFENYHLCEPQRYEVDPETVGQWSGKEAADGEKIFAGEYLGEIVEYENGKEGWGHYGVVTYWEDRCCWVLADENGIANDWTYEDCAQPENWGKLYCLGSIHDNPELKGGE